MEQLNNIISNTTIMNIIFSFLLIIIAFIVTRFTNHFLFKKGIISKINKNKVYSAKKAINIITISVFIFLILSIWVSDPWSFLWGALGVVAIGFFAVWSILSNIVSGLLIMISQPFTIDDHITIMPDEISGKVLDYTYLFLKIYDEEKNATYIVPNNMVFQKILRKRYLEQHPSKNSPSDT